MKKLLQKILPLALILYPVLCSHLECGTKPGAPVAKTSDKSGQTCKERFEQKLLKPNETCSDASGNYLAEGPPD